MRKGGNHKTLKISYFFFAKIVHVQQTFYFFFASMIPYGYWIASILNHCLLYIFDKTKTEKYIVYKKIKIFFFSFLHFFAGK